MIVAVCLGGHGAMLMLAALDECCVIKEWNEDGKCIDYQR
jgi:hypothetical protein